MRRARAGAGCEERPPRAPRGRCARWTTLGVPLLAFTPRTRTRPALRSGAPFSTHRVAHLALEHTACQTARGGGFLRRGHAARAVPAVPPRTFATGERRATAGRSLHSAARALPTPPSELLVSPPIPTGEALRSHARDGTPEVTSGRPSTRLQGSRVRLSCAVRAPGTRAAHALADMRRGGAVPSGGRPDPLRRPRTSVGPTARCAAGAAKRPSRELRARLVRPGTRLRAHIRRHAAAREPDDRDRLSDPAIGSGYRTGHRTRLSDADSRRGSRTSL
jgi:hypothetical protein